MQRLGKNLGGYHGEVIDIRAVLRDVKAAAAAHGWRAETFFTLGDLELLALRRAPLSTLNSQPSTHLYISAGIHGDEPAGPLAALHLLQENNWPADCEVWLLPCLNPTGFILNCRENDARQDLNRDYRHLESEEVAAHIRWLERQPQFDLTLSLHEDWEAEGFYVYELNPDGHPALADQMIAAVAPQCPIDLSPVIEGRPANGGIINPSLDPVARAQWPEAFWLIQNKTRRSCTLEAPSDFLLATRINALVAAVRAAVNSAA